MSDEPAEAVSYMLSGMRPKAAPGKKHDAYGFQGIQAIQQANQANQAKVQEEKRRKSVIDTLNEHTDATSSLANYYNEVNVSEEEDAVEQAMRARMTAVLQLIETKPEEPEPVIDEPEPAPAEPEPEPLITPIAAPPAIEYLPTTAVFIEEPAELPPAPTPPVIAEKKATSSLLSDASRRRSTDSKYNGMTEEERKRQEEANTIKALKAIRKLEEEINQDHRGLKKGAGLWVRLFNMKRNFLISRKSQLLLLLCPLCAALDPPGFNLLHTCCIPDVALIALLMAPST